MGNVTHIHTKKAVPMVCRDCGHEWERKEADPDRRHRCPRCKKYNAVVLYSQVAPQSMWQCIICGGQHYAIKEDGLQCYKCGELLRPLDVWTHVWSSSYAIQPREDIDAGSENEECRDS